MLETDHTRTDSTAPLTRKQTLTYNSLMTKTVDNALEDVFSALSDPTRRRLLDLVATGDRPVKSLAEAFDMTRPAISQHLRILQRAGLVTERKVGREHHYALRAAPLREVHSWVQQYEHFWQERLDALGEHLDNAE